MKEPTSPGTPADKGNIPLCVPYINGNEWEYIKDCLDTNWVSSVGAYVDRFEDYIATYLGSKYAVATVNGTSALHIALLVAGVEPDDEVIVSTLTFVAPANAIRYVGAWPVFVDAEPDYWQMDTSLLEDFLTQGCKSVDGQLLNKATGRRVAGILPVHILGHPCEMAAITNLASQFSLPIIEDATEGLGASYKSQMVGTFGDIACLSFNGNKIITSGGGGMIVTNCLSWADKARYLTTQAKNDPIEYIHHEIGYNYRLSNIQAAMGLAQVEQLQRFIDRKREIAEAYYEGFADVEGISTMLIRPDSNPSYWLYTVLLPESISLDQRKTLISDLNSMGIGVRPLWMPNHQLPPFGGCQIIGGKESDNLYRRGLSLPSSVGLSQDEQIRSIESVKQSVENFIH